MSVDRHELQALIRDLEAIPPALRREARPAMIRAGKPVLGQMRADASWSTRIPGAISMRPSSATFGVTFRVDSVRAPHARPYEHDGEPGEFRHPVYGDRENWVPQGARLFFYGAVERQADAVVEALGDVVTDIAAAHGF